MHMHMYMCKYIYMLFVCVYLTYFIGWYIYMFIYFIIIFLCDFFKLKTNYDKTIIQNPTFCWTWKRVTAHGPQGSWLERVNTCWCHQQSDKQEVWIETIDEPTLQLSISVLTRMNPAVNTGGRSGSDLRPAAAQSDAAAEQRRKESELSKNLRNRITDRVGVSAWFSLRHRVMQMQMLWHTHTQ